MRSIDPTIDAGVKVAARRSSEQGQVLVLIIIAMVALLGFTALAIDVGHLYTSRRIAQNAADAAAYAAAANVANRIKKANTLVWGCAGLTDTHNDWVEAANEATSRASDNSLIIDASVGEVTNATGQVRVNYNIDDDNGIEFTCSEGAEDYIDVHVRLTQAVETSFIHVFNNQGEVKNTVDAVVRVRPGVIFGGGAAIIATRNACDPGKGGVIVGGAEDDQLAINLSDGGIISNHCCVVRGPASSVEVTGGTWTCNSTISIPEDEGDENRLDPNPVTGHDIEIDSTRVTQKLSQACDGLPGSPSDDLIVNGVTTVSPGSYGRVFVDEGAHLTLIDGLYCIHGDLEIRGRISGSNITIFMPKSAGVVTTYPEARVNLAAPPPGCQYDTPGCAPAAGGLLLLFLPGNPNQVILHGNSDSVFSGTVLAPNTTISITGTGSESPLHTAQFIGETILLDGKGTVNIHYDPSHLFQEPPLLSLQR